MNAKQHPTCMNGSYWFAITLPTVLKHHVHLSFWQAVLKTVPYVDVVSEMGLCVKKQKLRQNFGSLFENVVFARYFTALRRNCNCFVSFLYFKKFFLTFCHCSKDLMEHACFFQNTCFSLEGFRVFFLILVVWCCFCTDAVRIPALLNQQSHLKIPTLLYWCISIKR